jgi:hypothetical protein
MRWRTGCNKLFTESTITATKKSNYGKLPTPDQGTAHDIALVKRSITELIQNQWSEIKTTIDREVKTQVNKEIYKKHAEKTAFDEAEIRRLVRDEMRRAFAGGK